MDLLLVGLAGAVFAGAVLLPGGYSPQDAFQAGYQNTALFRREIEDQLESALRLARSADKSSWYSMEEEGSNLLCQLMIRSASGALADRVQQHRDGARRRLPRRVQLRPDL